MTRGQGPTVKTTKGHLIRKLEKVKQAEVCFKFFTNLLGAELVHMGYMCALNLKILNGKVSSTLI